MDTRRDILTAVDLGTAELVADPRRPAGWTLLIEDIAQSYVDLADPLHLEFEYTRQIADVLDAAAPARRPLRVLHLGGGALTLARYVAATRPGSRQQVVDRDRALMSLVRKVLPLPGGSGVRIRIADAREAIDAAPAGGYDVVISDVFRGAQMPAAVSSVEFATGVARALRPRGLFVVNVTDMPPLAFSRRQVATLRAAFPDVCVVSHPAMLRGRRFGNVVLAASTVDGGLPVSRLVGGRSRFLHGEALDRFVSGARPIQDHAARFAARER